MRFKSFFPILIGLFVCTSPFNPYVVSPCLADPTEALRLAQMTLRDAAQQEEQFADFFDSKASDQEKLDLIQERWNFDLSPTLLRRISDDLRLVATNIYESIQDDPLDYQSQGLFELLNSIDPSFSVDQARDRFVLIQRYIKLLEFRKLRAEFGRTRHVQQDVRDLHVAFFKTSEANLNLALAFLRREIPPALLSSINYLDIQVRTVQIGKRLAMKTTTSDSTFKGELRAMSAEITRLQETFRKEISPPKRNQSKNKDKKKKTKVKISLPLESRELLKKQFAETLLTRFNKTLIDDFLPSLEAIEYPRVMQILAVRTVMKVARAQIQSLEQLLQSEKDKQVRSLRQPKALTPNKTTAVVSDSLGNSMVPDPSEVPTHPLSELNLLLTVEEDPENASPETPEKEEPVEITEEAADEGLLFNETMDFNQQAKLITQKYYSDLRNTKKSKSGSNSNNDSIEKDASDPFLDEVRRNFSHQADWSEFLTFFDPEMSHQFFSFSDMVRIVKRAKGMVTFNESSHCKIVLRGGYGGSWSPHGKAKKQKLSRLCVQKFREVFEKAGITPQTLFPERL